MSKKADLNVYFVVGEESGDILGANLLTTLRERGGSVTANGLAGSRMQALGVESLFDVSDISVMGISGVAAKLPTLLRRIKMTVADVLKKQPDVLILIDSPEFSYRVARKVRTQNPGIKIVKYVAPSVWAWRPGRAKKIKPFIDHILAVLPFEPEILKKLDGPDATYVGHPLASEMPEIATQDKLLCNDPPRLVILPGSRRSEVKRLMPVIRETLGILAERGGKFECVLPAVSKLEGEIRNGIRGWPWQPEIVIGDDARKNAFRNSDIALAASGTVTLELALYKVPTISIYKLDGLAMRIRHLLTGWTASLPNLIADYPIVPEKFNEYAHPQYIARMVERLTLDDHERRLQLAGFETIVKRVKQDTPSHELAAQKILEIAGVGSN
ncbi:MAG: lipid-A-disaccharide synthase [Pseudomonadota bacterium]